jgi:hypothetical protein
VLSVPVFVGGGPVGTLDAYVTAPREWDDSETAALQAYAGLVASMLTAAVTAWVTGRLAAPLQAAVEHRSLLERAIAFLVHREGMGAARQYERRGQPGRARTERLQAAAARGRIIDAEAERRRADQQP